MLETLHASSHSILQQPNDMAFIKPVVKMEKLRQREFNKHRVSPSSA